MDTDRTKHRYMEQAKQLKESFLQNLPPRIDKIRQLIRQLDKAEPDSYADLLQSLHFETHSLAGTSGTFGFHNISQCAKQLARIARDHKQIVDQQTLDTLKDFDSLLEEACRKLSHTATSNILDLPQQNRQDAPLIYIVDDDVHFLDSLATSIRQYGYKVYGFSSVEDFFLAVENKTPGIVIMDIILNEGLRGGIEAACQLNQGREEAIPIIYLSQVNDIETKKVALENYARFYFTKPLDLQNLLHALDILASRYVHDPLRILLVDDDKETAQFYSLVLEQAGMETRILTQPLEALSILEDYQPDLILLDLYMPEINGFELAQVIRLDPKNQFVSIVFLSSELNREQHLHAVQLGGDDFLTKPVSHELLIKVVQARANRTRSYNSISREYRRTVNELEQFKIALDEHAIVSISDTQGKITYANQKFLDISKYDYDELIGKNHSILNSGYHPDTFFKQMWDTITHGKNWHGVICNRNKSGENYWVDSSIIPFLDEEGLPYQYASIRTDINDLMLLKEDLATKEERLRRSQIYAHIGTWDWNIQTGELYWSELIGPLFGYEGLVETSYDNFVNALHPKDRDYVTQAVNDCIQNGAVYDIEHRIVRTDGEVRWLSEKGDVVRSEDGKPLHMLGVVQDITRRKMAEQLLDILQETSAFAISQQNNLSSAFEMLLTRLLQITDSEYGFIGEVKHTDEGAPYLKTHAITDISWNDETKTFYQNNAPDGLEFHNLDTLFGLVLSSGEPIISNNPAEHPSAAGLPPGHPPLNAFMGIPIYYFGELLGMYGLANRKQGYDEDLANFLQPLNTTCSRILHGLIISREREETHHAMILAKEEAESANKAKSDFLSRMSHELRTPLNAILGFGQLMDADNDHPLQGSHKENIDHILHAGWHLLDLINEVLELSKIESGNLQLALEPVDLYELIVESIKLNEPTASDKTITIINNADTSQNLYVLADKMRLKQVILNLLSNAIKYNRVGGMVQINTTRKDGMIYLSVEDSGMGLNASQMQNLFQPFNRLGAESTGIEGTGIGLVISKSLVELMRGEISISSTPGQGSTFTISLHDVSNSQLQQQNTEKQHITHLQNHDARLFEILYVEDNPANLKLMQQALGIYDYFHLTTATDAESGIQMAFNKPFDLIILDINLPGIDGYEACKILRHNETDRHIPIVALSANAMDEDIHKGEAVGFDDYFTKPLNIAKFLDRLKEILQPR